MKIWKAELILICGENIKYEIDFYFELQEKEYKLNEKFNEWIHSKSWICSRIPMKMSIESEYSLKVMQGFDRELNKEELKNLKEEMKKFMIAYLEQENEIILKRYNDKVKTITEED